MQFDTQLLEGRLVDRYKRFFADVKLPDGEVVVTHCANPGSMANCRPDNARVWISVSDNPKRKLRYTWELVEVDDTLVVVNTGRPNRVVEEALRAGRVAELAGYDEVRPEVKYGDGSRVDFLLTRDDGAERCWVEVKSVTLGLGDGLSAFPDSVSARGTRHLRELMSMVEQGDRAVMLFACGRADTRRMTPADDIDPTYGQTLREAAAAGVELLAYSCEVSLDGIWLGERIPIQL